MPATRMLLHSDLRAGWRGWSALALLLGLIGGVVLLTAAGARRTDTAYPRFLAASGAADVLVSPGQTGLTGYYAALAQLPEVQALATAVGISGYTGNPRNELLVDASVDGRFLTALERPKLLEGRMFPASQPWEVLTDRSTAARYHLHPGSRLPMVTGPSTARGIDAAHARTVTLTVVGIVATRDDVVTVNANAEVPKLLATPAFVRQFDPSFYSFDGGYVRLRPGTSITHFQAQAEAVAAQHPDAGSPIFVADEHQQAASVQRAIRPQAVAWGLFSLLLGVTTLVVIGQLGSRQVALAGSDHPALRALGMSPRELRLARVTEVSIMAAAGSLVAMIVAFLGSPFTPVGPARIAEPHPGFHVDWLILGAGAAAMTVVVVAWASVTVWRQLSSPALAGAAVVDRPSRMAEAVGGRIGPSTSVGLRFALRPGVSGAASHPGALAASAVAIGALTAALTFGASLIRLVGTPRLYGQTWSYAVDWQFEPVPRELLTTYLQSHARGAAWTFGVHLSVTIGHSTIPAVALVPGRGLPIWPTVLEGRAPRSPDEIVLGTKSLEAIGHRVGDTVAVTPPGGDTPRQMRIVGRTVFPFFGLGSFTPTGLGVGAAFEDPAPDPAGSTFMLVRSNGVPTVPSTDDLHAQGVCPSDQNCSVFTAQRPLDLIDYANVQNTPLALAGVLAVLALAALAHALVTTTSRRRRDFAVLKTLGFVRGQVAGAVLSEASVLVVLALLVGVPLGAAAGRWLWTVFANRLGVLPVPVVPPWFLIGVVPVTLAVANLLAAIPGLVAARRPAAPVLRTE